MDSEMKLMDTFRQAKSDHLPKGLVVRRGRDGADARMRVKDAMQQVFVLMRGDPTWITVKRISTEFNVDAPVVRALISKLKDEFLMKYAAVLANEPRKGYRFLTREDYIKEMLSRLLTAFYHERSARKIYRYAKKHSVDPDIQRASLVLDQCCSDLIDQKIQILRANKVLRDLFKDIKKKNQKNKDMLDEEFSTSKRGREEQNFDSANEYA